MSTPKTQTEVKKVSQKVQLVEGLFTPSEAKHIIDVLIQQKVNFHKLQRLSICEGNENSDTTYETNRIEELNNEKEIAKNYISIARKEGYNVIINGTLNISFVK